MPLWAIIVVSIVGGLAVLNWVVFPLIISVIALFQMRRAQKAADELLREMTEDDDLFV